MKKIMNQPGTIVEEMLQGLALCNPRLTCFPDKRVIARKEKAVKVGIVTAGGSGHEPAHAGYVGMGMLDAAVAGNVFASPSPDQMLKGIEEANTGKGVLMVLKNYTGDQMNFSMAREFAEMNGITVDSVVVKDDVAVPDSTYSAGRRGIAGTVFIHKIAGAKAQQGADLEQVRQTAEKAISRLRTMGMSMTACTLPGLDKPGFELGENEIEIGMGIHGEPGIEKISMKTSREIAGILLEKILDDYDYYGADAAMLVNGLGGTPLMELYVLAKDAAEILNEKDISLSRVYVGNYVTALDMTGCSISLLKLDEELTGLLDAPCDTPAWKNLG